MKYALLVVFAIASCLILVGSLANAVFSHVTGANPVDALIIVGGALVLVYISVNLAIEEA